MDSVEFWEMKPSDHLVDRGYCLAHEGREYIIYQSDTLPFSLDLGNVSGPFESEWLHPFSGEHFSGPELGPGCRQLTPPSELLLTPIVLHVKKR
jgi:hypothetical protein